MQVAAKMPCELHFVRHEKIEFAKIGGFGPFCAFCYSFDESVLFTTPECDQARFRKRILLDDDGLIFFHFPKSEAVVAEWAT